LALNIFFLKTSSSASEEQMSAKTSSMTEILQLNKANTNEKTNEEYPWGFNF